MDPRTLTKYAGASTQTPNFGPRLNQAIWCLTAFPAVFLALRLWCKIRRRRPLWWDDYVLILSWVALLSSTTILSVGVEYGIGLQYDDMEDRYVPITSQLSYAAGFSAILAAAWSKTSFALSLLRITNGRTKWFVWFIIVTVNIVLGVSATVLWITCWPVAKLWYSDIEGRCWPTTVVEKYQTFASSYSGAMDIILALLPWKIVWAAAIFKTEKIGALLAMSLGIFSGIITFMKILVLPEMSDTASTTVNLKIFGTAEPAAAIIAASIPVLRALIRRHPRSQPAHTQFVRLSELPGNASPVLRRSKSTRRTTTNTSDSKGPGRTYSTESSRCVCGASDWVNTSHVCAA